MRRTLFVLVTILLLSIATIPVFSNESEDFQPINAGMTLKFIQIIAHIDQKDKTWQINVVKNSFPESITYTWTRQDKSGASLTGTRILTNLTSSRDFNPWFKKNETKVTDDTAPWLSIDVLKELRMNGTAAKFKEGGTGALNWASVDLTVKEKVIFPVTINGKAEAIHGLKLNKGLVVWNNLKNPLILEYEPLGIPLVTSITGWKLVSIDY